MSGFKLIAIIPLNGCDKKFSKNLKIGFPYQFYQDYEIALDKDNTKIEAITQHQENKVPHNFYNLSNGISLSVSAVVGKNGSGKSTIFELLFYIVYLLGSRDKVFQTPLHDLVSQKWYIENEELKLFEDQINNQNLILDLIDKYKIKLPKKILGDNIKIIEFIKNFLLTKNRDIEFQRVFEAEFEDRLRNGLSVSVLYEIDGNIKEIRFIQGLLYYTNYVQSPAESSNENTLKYEAKDGEPLEQTEVFNLEYFFYSISLNYSHHSLNSRVLGSWINKLFHKNDAYTTPVVINPMRIEGNFDINDERKLSKERLFASVIYDLVNKRESRLLDKYRVSKFIFSTKKSGNIPLGYDKNYINNLNSHFIFKNLNIAHIETNIKWWDRAIAYLEGKIPKIEENYERQIFTKENLEKSKSLANGFNEVENFILNDKTHITKKIRQVINFLKITNENREFWNSINEDLDIEITPDKMIQYIDLFGLDLNSITPTELTEYALPGFFNVDFVLTDETNASFEFETLSSGEQQMIYNLNSILYHLNNIQSVHSSEDGDRVKYDNVNIFLDEIELYFHPEFQRKFVKNLLDSMKSIKRKGDRGISSINICFSTHSPFILSDIPANNILRLGSEERSVKYETETFGANINDLLANDFFLENGFMGEFAKNYIVNLFAKLYELVESKNISISNEEYVVLFEKIELIGERIIRVRLEDLLNEIPREKSVEDLEIENLSRRLQELKRNRRYNAKN